MKPIFTIVGAVSFMAFASCFVNAAPTAADPNARVRSAEPLRRYCVDVLGAKRPRAALGHRAFHPLDCIGLFYAASDAEPGQPGRGGDGGGFPGAPGGRGGESGAPGGGRGGDGGSVLFGLPRGPGGRGAVGPAPEDLAVDDAFVDYCVKVVQSRGRVTSDDFVPSDCAYYLMALDRLSKYRSDGKAPPASAKSGSAKDGSDGPSVGGGVGGRGGRAGSGPGGGTGGAGGAGVEGFGGAGGAGGASR